MPMKRILSIVAILIIISACSPFANSYRRYQDEFYDTFDTITIVCGYARNEKEFQRYSDVMYQEMLRLHKLFDVYNDYEGVNNLKTVNDSACISPVTVDPSVIELLLDAKLAYTESSGAVNVAMGSVLRVWHEHRKLGIGSPENAKLPDMDILKEAKRHTNIDDLIIDEASSTVFMKDPQMALDVGALAKGFAVQKAIVAAKEAGFKSGFISAGGNISTVGIPMDGRDAWSVGVESPKSIPNSQQPLYDTVFVSDKAVVTSGDNQRFYIVDGKSYHHIIDPETLMPAEWFSCVSIIHPDSATADMLSTALYILPYEQGASLLSKHGADAIWIAHDGTALATDGYKAVSKMFSGHGN